MSKILNKILSKYSGDKSDLIPILQDTQSNLGYLSEDAIVAVSKFTGIPESEIYGVVTFYKHFRLAPVGKKHVMVCKGTACHVKGVSRIIEGIERHLGIKHGEVTFDMEYSLEYVGCLGCCALAPCAMVNTNLESNLTLKDVKKIFSRIKRESKNKDCN